MVSRLDNPMAVAIAANNEAALRLSRNGLCATAVQTLRQALRLLMHQEAEPQPRSAAEDAENRHEYEAHSASPLHRDARLCSLQMYPTTDLDAGLLEIYRCVLVLRLDERDESLVTSVLLYNLAILSHCRGINEGKSKHLRVALRLYNMVFDIVRSRAEEDEDRGSSISDLLLLALFNNMAHVVSIECCLMLILIACTSQLTPCMSPFTARRTLSARSDKVVLWLLERGPERYKTTYGRRNEPRSEGT